MPIPPVSDQPDTVPRPSCPPAPPPPAGVEAKPPVVTPLGPFFGVLPNRSSSRSASALLDLAVDIGVLVVAPPFIAFMLFPFIDVEFEREKLSMRFSSPLMVPRGGTHTL